VFSVEEKLARLFSLVLIIPVFALGYCNLSNNFSAPREFLVADNQEDRQPASSDDPQKSPSPYTFYIDCESENNLTTKAKRLRIVGQLCLKTKKQTRSSSAIHNKTNGYRATVFSLDKKRFTTDYITLEEGQNEIDIKHLLSNGKYDSLKVSVVRKL
jgi:hypothetical protein